MLEDRFGNPISTSSNDARDSYAKGLDLFLASDSGVATAFGEALAADETFAMAHLGLARFHHVTGNKSNALASLAQARALGKNVTDQERSLIHTLGLLIEGKPVLAYEAVRLHLREYPRDALATQTCTTVFGLIGFSGLPGRDAEQLAFTTGLVPFYGDDWWFLSQHAFSQVEVGQVGPAEENILKSIEGNPRSAQGAHIYSHILYEQGNTETGREYLTDWLDGYDREGLLHCHISWHAALWALEAGDVDDMWTFIDQSVLPSAAQGPPLVIMCDVAAGLFRAWLAGIDVPKEKWEEASNFAAAQFPKTGIAFGDVHAAILYAMAGNNGELDRIIDSARGPAGDLVQKLAKAFREVAVNNWKEAESCLVAVMCDHVRIGGSLAQRDLIELALAKSLREQGKVDEARRLLAIRRPLLSGTLFG